MGAADVVPGVSGGTMAFIMGVYEELLDAIKSFNLKWLKFVFAFKIKKAVEHIPWKFLAVLGAGIACAFLSLAHLISWLLDAYPVYLYAFFFGLVAASIVAISVHIRWTLGAAVALIAGGVIAYIVVGLVPLETPHDPLTLFVSGGVAIMAMILPGISGSFILLILGQYEFVINAVKALQVGTLIPLALGCGVGIMLFARLLSWLLKHYHQITITLLVGFMLGSLRKIWPFKIMLKTMTDSHGGEIPMIQENVLPAFSVEQFWVPLGLALMGFMLIYCLNRIQRKNVSFAPNPNGA